LAKTSGWLININLFLLLLFQIKSIKKILFIPFSIKYTHYFVVFYLYLWSLIHIISHYVNFSKLSNITNNLFNWGVGFTGHILIICLFLFILFSLPYFRKFKFHAFIAIHYSLLFFVLFFTSIHGSFCFFKPDVNSGVKCFPPTTWIWIIIPTFILFYEILYKYLSKKHKINNVILHHGNIYEVVLNLDISYLGKTIYVCCPDISHIEWHPFTVCKSSNNNYCSLYIKIRGNWTTKFANLLGISSVDSVFSTIYPEIFIDGPFLSFPKNINDIINTKTTLFISSGIGLTTFHHILYNLYLNKSAKNMHFVIISKTKDEILWILDLLKKINNIQNFHLYIFFTSEQPTKLLNIDLPYSLGRPNFECILNYLHLIHDSSSGHPYIFYSGRNSIQNDILILKKKYIMNSRFYHL
jgi:NADPH oxidase